MAAASALKDRLAEPRWRLNNLYWITDKAGHKVRFEPNWAQLRLLDELHCLNVILKARQLGMTTFIQLMMLDACLFTSNIRAGVIAHNREDAEAIFRDKVKFAYDNLPEQLRIQRAAQQDSARELTFANNSSIRVGTSLRSGTLQYLHVSEYGKICAKYPEKAREVKTGAFNTVQAGQMIFVESTAEGQEGDFYDMCQKAQSLERRGIEPGSLDFKFHFYPWWEHSEYRIDPGSTVISAELEGYFERLRAEHGIDLDAAQKAWYAKKLESQGVDMKREFPSTPEEAFEASVEGAYYAQELAKMEQDRRIGPVPHVDGLMVHTWWDLGINDLMTLWFVQWDGPWLNVIDCYHNSGEGLAHYAAVLQEKQHKRGFIYGEHVWPHDGNVRILDEKGRSRTQVMRDLGYEPVVVERGIVHTGIQQARSLLSRTRIDEARCAEGVKALRNYRKDWDEDRGTWRPNPRHDWASHFADAFRTGAMRGNPGEIIEENWDEIDWDRDSTSGY